MKTIHKLSDRDRASAGRWIERASDLCHEYHLLEGACERIISGGDENLRPAEKYWDKHGDTIIAYKEWQQGRIDTMQFLHDMGWTAKD